MSCSPIKSLAPDGASPPDAAITPTADAGGDAGDATLVSGVVADVYVTAGGDMTVPTDISGKTIEVYKGDGKGGLVRYPGSGHADGTFSVDGVPPGGMIDLRIGNSYYHTTQRQFDLGNVLVQRPDAALPTKATPLQLDITGMTAWQSGDSLELVSATGGVYLTPVGLGSPALTVPNAATSLSASFDYFADAKQTYGGPMPLVDTSKGDDVCPHSAPRPATTSSSTA